jgi:hypothetical protein
MYAAKAHVHTERADRYRKQLSSHLGRRCAVMETADGICIALPEDTADARCLLINTPDALILSAEGSSFESLAQVKDVVGRHLEAFGDRDGLKVTWVDTTN